MERMVLVMIQYFFVPELNKTMAEITNDEKGKISHRGNAIRLLKEYLEGEQHV